MTRLGTSSRRVNESYIARAGIAPIKLASSLVLRGRIKQINTKPSKQGEELMAIRPDMEDTYQSGVLSQGRYEKVLEGVGVS